jgi:hypothetical protein
MNMRISGVLLCCLNLIVSVCLEIDTPAQKQPAAPQVFTVESLDGCRLRLKNDDVKILSWSTSSYDRNLMSLAKFVRAPKKGEQKLTPQTGVLLIPLDKLSYRRLFMLYAVYSIGSRTSPFV